MEVNEPPKQSAFEFEHIKTTTPIRHEINSELKKHPLNRLSLVFQRSEPRKRIGDLFGGTWNNRTAVPGLFGGTRKNRTAVPRLFGGTRKNRTAVPRLFGGTRNHCTAVPNPRISLSEF